MANNLDDTTDFAKRLKTHNIKLYQFFEVLAAWRQLPKSDREVLIDVAKKSYKSVVDYERIVEMYNKTCVSLSRVNIVSTSRQRAMKTRLNNGYTYDDFERLFISAENSSFLKGNNDRHWTATFDWLITESNMAKVLDGNYQDKGNSAAKSASYDINEVESFLNQGLL